MELRQVYAQGTETLKSQIKGFKQVIPTYAQKAKL